MELSGAEYEVLRVAIFKGCYRLGWKPDEDTVQHCWLRLCQTMRRCGRSALVETPKLRCAVIRCAIVDVVRKRGGRNGCVRPKMMSLDWEERREGKFPDPVAVGRAPLEMLIDEENAREVVEVARGALNPTGQRILDRILAGDSRSQITRAVGRTHAVIDWHRRRMKRALRMAAGEPVPRGAV